MDKIPRVSKQLRLYHERIQRGVCVACGKATPVNGTRRCGKCREIRRLISQRQKRNRPTGACNQCCIRPALPNRASCSACTERARAKSLETYRKYRVDVLELYGGSCRCCGNRNMKYLQLDHVNNDGGKERKILPVACRGGRFFQYVLKLGYKRKDLQVLCANCHNAKRYGGCTREDHPLSKGMKRRSKP